MRTDDLLKVIEPQVMLLARGAAERTGSRFVIGWWNDGAPRRLMLLPEGHHLTAEPAFLPVMLVAPSGRAELLAA